MLSRLVWVFFFFFVLDCVGSVFPSSITFDPPADVHHCIKPFLPSSCYITAATPQAAAVPIHFERPLLRDEWPYLQMLERLCCYIITDMGLEEQHE